MLREAYALTADRDLVDEAVNPRRLKQQSKTRAASGPNSTTSSQSNDSIKQTHSKQIPEHSQQVGYKNTRGMFDEMPKRGTQQENPQLPP